MAKTTTKVNGWEWNLKGFGLGIAITFGGPSRVRFLAVLGPINVSYGRIVEA